MRTFRIQEFAKLAGVTVRALHHYDRLKLLSPAHRSERGYRLYCRADLGRLERILVLRYLGLSLREIATLLDASAGSDAESLTLTFARQRAALHERRDGLDRVLRAIEYAQLRAQDPAEPEWLLYQTILKEIKMQETTDWTEKYYSPKAAEALREQRAALTPEQMAETLTSASYTSAPTPLTSGAATINIAAGSLTLGTNTLTVNYTPDSNSSSTYGSSIGSKTVKVTGTSADTLTLSANPISGIYGQPVVLSATLSPYSTQGSSSNGETITFSNGSTVLGSGTLNNGLATFTLSTLPAGSASLTAAYAGDNTFIASVSSPLAYTVLLAPTITFSVPNHTNGDAPFTVSAVSNSSGAITYSVISGPATISGSTVTLTGGGTVVLQASQAASGNYAATTQNATFTVAVGPQTITFAAPTSPISYGAAPISLSASASSGLAVTFSVLSGPASISGNTLTITGAGTVVVAADQPGNASYSAAPEITHTITVNKITASVGLTASPTTILAQNPVALTATVTSSIGTPTGSVTFSDSGTTLGSGAVVGGVATLSASTLAATGSHSITATYNGDANFNSATSAAVSETVQDFSFTPTTSSQTVQPGGTATYTIPVSVSGGTTLPAAVSFSVTGVPTGYTAAFSPATLAAGSSATNVTLTVQVPTTAMVQRKFFPNIGAPLMAFGVLLLPLAGAIKRSQIRLRRLAMLVVMLAGAGAVAGLIGCGGGGGGSSIGGGGGTQPQTYTLTVTATSGTLSHSTTVTLTVQ